MNVAYDLALGGAALVASPLWAYRLLRTGKWRTDWPARFGRCPALAANGRRTILIHAVSVGEVNAVRQLVEALRGQTDWHVVISTTTDTGTARARALYEPRHRVVRYPIDFTWSVARFLDAVQPDLVALVELEVWPNFCDLCRLRGVPVAVVNGRLSKSSFRGYRLARALVRPMFAGLAAAAVQTPDYGQRFEALGVAADRVHVLDSMKWDTARIADDVEGSEALAEAMGIDRSRPLIVAGSTAPGEERLLAASCPEAAQLLLAPRRPEWFDAAARMEPGTIRRTACPDGTRRAPDGRRFFVLDTIGELGKAYALADVAVVGRSFLDMGGSDMIEPVALGKPTIVGPFHDNFQEVVAALRASDAVVVTDAPGPALAELLGNSDRAAAAAERGRQVIRAHQGATQRHVELLRRLMHKRGEGQRCVAVGQLGRAET